MPTHDAKLTVRLPGEHVAALRRGAAAEDRTVPIVLRRLVREYAGQVTGSSQTSAREDTRATRDDPIRAGRREES